jgi:hypothetical protein
VETLDPMMKSLASLGVFENIFLAPNSLRIPAWMLFKIIPNLTKQE